MTSKEWKEYTVQELIDMKMLEEPLDGNHGNLHPKSSDYVASGVPFIMANNLEHNSISYDSCVFLSETQANMLKKGIARPGDVLITHKATIGRTAIVPDIYEKIILTPQVTYYRVKKGIYNKYLKYYFDTPKFQQIFNNWAGAGSTRAYLGITAQHKLPIVLPPLETQEKIARVLSSLDDKIELNNKINQNLEQQAQAIFKSWFVDFEPFGGNMPENWERSNLLEIANYLNGLAMQKYRPKENELYIPVLKIKELRQGFCDNTSDICTENINDAYIVNNGDIIFSWSGSLLVDIWCGGKCGLNQHLFKVTSEKYDKWFYYFWTKHHLSKFVVLASDMATTMGHIKREELQKSEVIIPNKEDYQKINNIIDPILNLIINNKIQNKQLTQLRDTLLPKLMSGEINVDKVEV